jgi:hypothetical protein
MQNLWSEGKSTTDPEIVRRYTEKLNNLNRQYGDTVCRGCLDENHNFPPHHGCYFLTEIVNGKCPHYLKFR